MFGGPSQPTPTYNTPNHLTTTITKPQTKQLSLSPSNHVLCADSLKMAILGLAVANPGVRTYWRLTDPDLPYMYIHAYQIPPIRGIRTHEKNR